MMDILGNSSSYDSSLPWLWAIEYLAAFKEIDRSVLQELVDMLPESTEDLAKSTREMVALRSLEDLFDSSDGLNKDGVSAMENKIVFDLSRSCEDVLQHILQEIPEADPKPDLSKWDVHPFIMHKRATMSKCYLQQLKDTILEGTHPLAASLKESGGLMRVNECGRSRVDDAQSVEQISVPPHGNELLERVVGATEGEGCDFADQSRDEVMAESQYPEDGHDERVDSERPWQNGVFQCSQKVVGHVADKLPQDTSVDEPVDKVIVDDTNVTELRSSTGRPSTETQRKDSANESKGEMEHLREEEVSSDNDEYHNERIDVDMKKSHFLSSQSSLGNDTLAMADWTEQNLCVKCNKDGQLLFCNTSSCLLVVHKYCLGFSAKFDENGNFCCPFCAYSLATSEYLEAKKKASLAKKELAAFIHTGLEHRPRELDVRLHRKDHSEQNGHKEIGDNGQLGDQVKERTNQNGQHGHDATVCW